MSAEQKSRVQTQFGASADGYAVSDVHAAGESLGLLVDLTAPQADWKMLDVGTGAGHTSLTFAPLVGQVLATDITQPMLDKTDELAQRKRLDNVQTAFADAESLPFDDETFDFATCRLACHHFPAPDKALREMARVLKTKGTLGFTDNFTVEDPAAANYYNRYETLRDPSHFKVLSLSELQSRIEAAGFELLHRRELSKEFEFHKWADRQHVSNEDKQTLLQMMRELPDELAPLFQPRWADETMYFQLWEAVIVARKC